MLFVFLVASVCLLPRYDISGVTAASYVINFALQLRSCLTQELDFDQRQYETGTVYC